MPRISKAQKVQNVKNMFNIIKSLESFDDDVSNAEKIFNALDAKLSGFHYVSGYNNIEDGFVKMISNVKNDKVLNGKYKIVIDELNGRISEENVKRYPKIQFILNLNNKNVSFLNGEIIKNLELYIDGFNIPIELHDIKFRINKYNVGNGYGSMIVRGFNLSLYNIFGDVVQDNKNENGKCAYDYLYKKYNHNIGKHNFEHYFKNKDITVDMIVNFCILHRIKCVLFDVKGCIIKSNYDHNSEKKLSCLVGVIYNNHIYPLATKYQMLYKKIYDTKKIKAVNTDMIETKFNECIYNDNVLPSNIQIQKFVDGNNTFIGVNSFVHNDILYYYNKDEDKIKNILNKFGLGDKYEPTMRMKNVINAIEDLYTDNKSCSFFPIRDGKLAMNYYNKYSNDVVGIDKNKAYSCALKNLPFLSSVNMMCIQPIKYNGDFKNENIIDQNLYVCSGNFKLLFPNNGFYSG